jgi:DNA processing protein
MDMTQLPIDDRTRLVALALTRHVGRVLIQRLLDRFGLLSEVFEATPAELRSVQGIGAQIAAAISAIDLSQIANDLQRFDSQGITTATYHDPHYPAALANIEDKPLAVFWKGKLLPEDTQAIAIVGTREGQSASLSLADQWGYELAQRGWTIVSGLARGIDMAAHQGALRASERTIAVLGCGVNVVYPPENIQLARDIVANGAIISEVHPDNTPSPNALVRRNRLTTALSRAVIIVEAGASSGALHAANAANVQGRPVFVVNNSAGNAALLDQFALPLPATPDDLIQTIEDIETKRVIP